MRITGNDKLDPDFSKIKKKERILGIVTEESLMGQHPTQPLIPRMAPRCANCESGKPYHVVLKYLPLLGGAIPFFKVGKGYFLVCTHCGETVELETVEYLAIKPWMEKARRD